MSVENHQMSASQTTRTITSTVSQFAEQLQLHTAVELMPSAIKSKTMRKSSYVYAYEHTQSFLVRCDTAG